MVSSPGTVAHKTVPMFCHLGQMDLMWSDDTSNGSETFIKQTTHFGFIEHLWSCDLDKNTWSNEQNHIVTHWDRFVSIYVLPLLKPKMISNVTVGTINNVM